VRYVKAIALSGASAAFFLTIAVFTNTGLIGLTPAPVGMEISWTAHAMPSSQSWSSVTYGNAAFVAMPNVSAPAATKAADSGTARFSSYS
jgi:hypothetical protein